MHFSIPDTEEFKEQNGASFIAYSIHINGVFHCCVRYRQLHNLHQQLCKEFISSTLPSFPPKKLLSLTTIQIEERRIALEKYILQLGQDYRVLNNDVFNGWLVWAQNESQKVGVFEDIPIELYMMNWQKITFQVSPTLQTNDLLEKVCKYLGLPSQLIYRFSLFLVQKEDTELIVLKKLQDFESPYISQKCSKIPLKIVLRKSYWDLCDDNEVIEDKVGLNCLYIQTVAEIEKGWILASNETLHQLAALQARGSKKEYLELAQTLKYYGYMQFQPCVCDFPQPNTEVLIAAGNKELNFRIKSEDGTYQEGNFKVTRIRCWRISSLKQEYSAPSLKMTTSKKGIEGKNSNQIGEPDIDFPDSLELSFEYLMNRSEMRWIKVISHQAVLISLCLQGMVQQLLGTKEMSSHKSPSERIRKGSLSYMKRDGSSTKIILNHTGEPLDYGGIYASPIGELSWRRLSERLSEFSFLENHRLTASDVNGRQDSNLVENTAFNVIGDDNL